MVPAGVSARTHRLRPLYIPLLQMKPFSGREEEFLVFNAAVDDEAYDALLFFHWTCRLSNVMGVVITVRLSVPFRGVPIACPWRPVTALTGSDQGSRRLQ